MKKRIIESAGILAGLLLLFLGINLLAGNIGENTVMIDGEVYSTIDSEINLTLMTEEGLGKITKCRRLKKLSIIPYTEAVRRSVKDDIDTETGRQIDRMIGETYDGYTLVEDISFLSGMTQLEELDISYCHVSDISVLKELTGLKRLDISYTEVKELSVLSEIDSLVWVNISGLDAGDISMIERDGLTIVCDEDEENEDE